MKTFALSLLGSPLLFAADSDALRHSLRSSSVKKESKKSEKSTGDNPNFKRTIEECSGDSKLFRLNLLTDKYGDETSFRLEQLVSETKWLQILHLPSDENKFRQYSEYSFIDCLQSGFSYKLTISDTYRDGLCCENGDGSYSYWIDGDVQFDSNHEQTFQDEAVHEFYIGTEIKTTHSFEVNYDIYDNQNTPSNQFEHLSQAEAEEQSIVQLPTEPEPEPESEADPEINPEIEQELNEEDPKPEPESEPEADPEPEMITPFAGRSSACGEGMQQIRINIQFDKWGEENSWELRNTDTGEKITGEPMGTYEAMDFESLMICLEDGNYRFTIFDDFGNGICCSEGQGYYELSMDDETIVYDKFGTGESRSNDFIVGYYKTLFISQRELDYLHEHNTRRKYYHEKFAGSYVPLKYSMGLASDARAWAEELLDDCDTDGIMHDPNRNLQGENLAKAVGYHGDWGELKPVSNIVTRWVEREETWSWPENAHFTQALWRAARYIGCGESVKSMGEGKMCRVQVCRYTRTGNCGMGDGLNWKENMMEDYSNCGHACPPEGCF